MLLHLCVAFLATMSSGIWNKQGTTDHERVKPAVFWIISRCKITK